MDPAENLLQDKELSYGLPKGTVEKPKSECTSLLVRFFSKIKQLRYKHIQISKKSQKQAFALQKHFFNTP
jgi:hypothetical protein